MEGGEGDEVRFVVMGRKGIESMTDLFDVDCPAE